MPTGNCVTPRRALPHKHLLVPHSISVAYADESNLRLELRPAGFQGRKWIIVFFAAWPRGGVLRSRPVQNGNLDGLLQGRVLSHGYFLGQIPLVLSCVAVVIE